MQGCEIWFVRIEICVPLDLVAVGNKFGKVYIFSLSGNYSKRDVNIVNKSGAEKNGKKNRRSSPDIGDGDSEIEAHLVRKLFISLFTFLVSQHDLYRI
jgi:hypothetical protein